MIAIVGLAVSLTHNTASAQGISVELDFGYNSPGGDFGDVYSGGIGIALHPRFKLTDKMAVGLNVGSNVFAGGDFSGSGGPSSSVSAAGTLNVLGTVQYKLLDKKITPYGELGVGMFKYKAGSIDSGSAQNGGAFEDKTYMGVAPKVGAMIGFLNVHATYVLAGDLKYTQFGLGFRFGAK